MREITREAGQKNSTAFQYHFPSKEAVISAIVVRRMKDGDYRRLEFLHELELRGKLDDLRSLAAALVEPIAVGIRSPKHKPGERCWVRFLSEVQRRPEFDLVGISKAASDLGLRRVYTLLRKQLRHVPDVVLRQRFLITMSQIVHGLAEIDQLQERRGRSRRRFDVDCAIENLIDMTAGALSAPVSVEVTRQTEPLIKSIDDTSTIRSGGKV
jgi:AcrR family transcriptional regulator